MKEIDALWSERVQSYIKEVRRYLKYMLNDHLVFVLIFGGGAGIYYYSNWVKTLTPSFPAPLVMAVILGLFLAASPVLTLLREADAVFLLPLEEKMKGFFRKGFRLSLIFQSYILLMVLAAMMPMYVQVTGNGFGSFFTLYLVLLVLKAWNLAMHWLVLKTGDTATLLIDQVIRYFVSASFLYFLLDEASFWFVGAVIFIILALTLYVRELVKTSHLKWDLLIEKEQGRMQLFYRTANLFTDVPHLKGQVKRRRWLDPIFSAIPYGTQHTYRFLFARALVRTSEFSGLVVRLTVIAGLILFFNGNMYVSLGVAVLFIYLTGFQLLPMLRRHDLKIWTRLYPIPESEKRKSFFDLLLKVLAGQAVLFCLASMAGGEWLTGLWVLGAGVIFAIVFARKYGPARMKKMTQ